MTHTPTELLRGSTPLSATTLREDYFNAQLVVHPLSSLLTPRGGSLGGSFRGGVGVGSLGGGLFGGRSLDNNRSLDINRSLGGLSFGGDAVGDGVVSGGGEDLPLPLALPLPRGLSPGCIRYYRWDNETNRRVPISFPVDDSTSWEEMLGLGSAPGQGLGSELAQGQGPGQESTRSVALSGTATGTGYGHTGHGHTTLRLLAVFEPGHRDWR